MSTYRCISKFGQSAASDPKNNPLTYCLADTLDNSFMHGAIVQTVSGPYSPNCQTFMAQYCAENEDQWKQGGVCDYASKNKNISFPNNIQQNGLESQVQGLTAGDVLVQNAAARKYVVYTEGICDIKYEPFDPTVASSPMIATWVNGVNSQNGKCVPVYAVNPVTIDNDPIMNRILEKPHIAWSILFNIYNTAYRQGKINDLDGTKLYAFFMSDKFQNYVKQLNMLNTGALRSNKC